MENHRKSDGRCKNKISSRAVVNTSTLTSLLVVWLALVRGNRDKLHCCNVPLFPLFMKGGLDKDLHVSDRGERRGITLAFIGQTEEYLGEGWSR